MGTQTLSSRKKNFGYVCPLEKGITILSHSLNDSACKICNLLIGSTVVFPLYNLLYYYLRLQQAQYREPNNLCACVIKLCK